MYPAENKGDPAQWEHDYEWPLLTVNYSFYATSARPVCPRVVIRVKAACAEQNDRQSSLQSARHQNASVKASGLEPVRI
jgi:hypothetical protein